MTWAPADIAAAIHCLHARSLTISGRADEAETVISAAEALVPGERWQFALERAALYYKAGRLDEALAEMDDVFDHLPPGRDEPAARAHNGAGVIKLYRGDDRFGLAHFAEAERLYLSAGRELDAAEVTYNRAMAMARTGDLVGSLRAFDAARQVLQSHDEPIDQLLVARAQVMLLAGLADDVAAELPQVIERLDAAGMAVDAAEARLYLASAQLRLGDPSAGPTATHTAEALRGHGRVGWAAIADDIGVEARWEASRPTADLSDAAEHAAAQLDDTGMRLFAGRSWLRAAQISMVENPDRARRALRRVVGRRSTIGERVEAYEAEARLAALDGDTAGARAAAERGLRLIERHRALLASSDLRAHASTSGAGLAEVLLDESLRDGDAWAVLNSIERWRARSISPSAESRDDPALNQALDAYRAAILSGYDETADRGTRSARSTRQTQLERTLSDALRRIAAGPAARPQPIPTAARTMEILDGRCLVELVERRGQLLAVVVEGGVARVAPVAEMSTATIATATWNQTLTRLARTPPGPAAAMMRRTATSAFDRLNIALGEVLRPLVGDAAEAVVCPPPGLQSVPWALLLHRPCSIIPSLSWLAARRSRPVSAKPGVGLCAGPGLHAALGEIRTVAGLYSAATIVRPDDATTTMVRRLLAEHDVVHIASHAEFKRGNPLLSALLLADGPMTAAELERLTTVPPLVVLAACASGEVRAYGSADGLGLSISLLRAGASVVIGSSVEIADDLCTRSFTELHRLLNDGVPVARALYEASTSLGLHDPEELAAAGALQCLGDGGWILRRATPRA